ncbi:MAG: CBS domain-containing protein [Candidatus Eisenbacteria bacterium]|nr:CBS domain-containing protein [Candidatus Eisenbacteria bacterium]
MKEDDKRPSKIQELAYELKVAQAMTTNMHTIGPEDTLNDLRIKLRDLRISGMPVCKNGKLVGIISIEDLVNCIMKGELDSKIGDKMTKDVEVLYADEPLTHAIRRFETSGFGRFPVLDRDTRELAGIMTKGDIVDCLLRKLEVDYHQEEVHRYRASHIFEDMISEYSTLELRYPVEGGNFKKAGEQSSKLKTDLLRLGVPPDITRRIVIACYEAEMNMVIFTQGGELKARVESNRVTVTAIDKGPGIADIELAMRPGYSTAPDWVRELGFGAGMGLPNIKNCSDEMKLESSVDEGTRLEFVVHDQR